MSSSPEYEAIVKYAVGLETALKGCGSGMVHFLETEGFIRESVAEDIRNPTSMLTERDKAGKLVEGIRDAVFMDKDMFHTLLEHLRKSGKFYKSTVDNLTKELVKLGGAVRQAEANESSQQSSDTSAQHTTTGELGVCVV